MNTAEQAPNLTTPLKEFTHRRHGSRVTLVGMVHAAQAGYYNQVQRLVAERENGGAVVHYEKVKKTPPEQLRHQSPIQRKKLEWLRNFVENAHLLVADTLHLPRQQDALTLHDSWENHDAVDVEIVKRLNGVSFTAQQLAFRGLFSLINKGTEASRYDLMVKNLKEKAALPDDYSLGIVGSLMMAGMSGPILDYRNGIALNAIDQRTDTNPETDFVLIWGAGHLPGLGQGLAERGYEQTDEQRLTAIDWELFHQTTPRPEEPSA
jgi:hypothetical protein